VVALRSGSAAQRSDCLQVGDSISAINGTKVAKLNAADVHQMLRTNDRVQLDVEYQLPSPSSYAGSTISSSSGRCHILSRTKDVLLVKDCGSDSAGFGFTIRGGASSSSTSTSTNEASKNRPLVITHIRPGSPAERDGTIQVGDRLISVSGQEVRTFNLSQAQKLLRESDKLVISIEYDVAVVDTAKYAQSPLLVEVERSCAALLGISLTSSSCDKNRRIYIESITPASIAERCGALHAGDQILALGEFRLDDGEMGVQEATRLLRNYSGDVVKLIIAPSGGLQRRSNDSGGSRRTLLPPPSPRPSNCSSSSSTLTKRKHISGRNKLNRMMHRVESFSSSASVRIETLSVGSSSSSPHPWSPTSTSGGPCGVMLSHPQLVSVTLQIDCRGSYGLALGQSQDHEGPVVLNVESNSPSDRAGCIQPGDRILRINQQSTAGLQLDEVVSMIKECKPRINLDVEFDVADSVVPASGVYWVKLVRRGLSYGITLAEPKIQRGEYLLVSEVGEGSIAHRTGSIQAGDKLLAINNSKIESMGVDDAILALQNEEVIRLKLQKGEGDQESEQLPVVYTVELVRRGGPLGITISGTESPNDPIFISGLAEGGLAERTGALHIGDRLLAINGRSLHGKLSSESIEILQNSGDVVTLKIGKSAKLPNSGELEREDYLPLKLPPLPSIDSAVESWASGASRANDTPVYTAESATVRRRQNTSREWEVHSSPSVDSGQFEVHYSTSSNSSPNQSGSDPGEGNDASCIRMSDLAMVQRCSTLPRNYRKIINQHNEDNTRTSPSYSMTASFPGTLPSNVQVHQITLMKDSVYEDFGFSVSDGLYERGIYINRVRKGGPADISGQLQAFDRILQVNDTRTFDFDCCLTVPLIAAAGESITLVVGRNPLSAHMDLKENTNGFNWDEEEEDGVIPADADDCTPSSVFSGVRTITTTL